MLYKQEGDFGRPSHRGGDSCMKRTKAEEQEVKVQAAAKRNKKAVEKALGIKPKERFNPFVEHSQR